MNERRQQILLAALILIAVLYVGDWVWRDKIEAPLGELQGRHLELMEEIEKKTKVAKATKKLPERISAWEKQALPAATETARSLYRNWLLKTIQTAKLRNVRVDSGAPLSRPGFKILPVNAQARGTLDAVTDALFAFENADLLHKIASIRLTPIGDSGQFDLAMSIEAVMMPGVKRRALNPGLTDRLVSPDRDSYNVIARDNIFGIAVDHRDPMKMTLLTGVVFSDGVPQAWITDQIADSLHKLPAGAEFDTPALSGRIAEVGDDWVIIQSGEDQLKLSVGQSLAEATVISGS